MNLFQKNWKPAPQPRGKECRKETTQRRISNIQSPEGKKNRYRKSQSETKPRSWECWCNSLCVPKQHSPVSRSLLMVGKFHCTTCKVHRNELWGVNPVIYCQFSNNSSNEMQFNLRGEVGFSLTLKNKDRTLKNIMWIIYNVLWGITRL